jgi:hypothetical protein
MSSSGSSQPASKYEGPLPGVRIPMAAVLRWGTLGSVVALAIAAALGYLLAGSEGLWGAVLGIAIPVVFYSITVVVAVVTVRVRPEVFGAAILRFLGGEDRCLDRRSCGLERGHFLQSRGLLHCIRRGNGGVLSR